jgi:predicted PurR-regulated permease PerM
MHHVGLLAGTAILTGALGNGILYVVGLVMTIPLLRRLRKRFKTVWAPVIGVGVFTALFSLSAFVVGPAIGSGGGQVPVKTPTPTVTTSDGHDLHH